MDRVPLASLRGWDFDAADLNLRHESGRFFTVEGLHVRGAPGAVPEWSQPIINQAEIGVLGLLVRKREHGVECLVQAKMEPGNPNVLQISPTVQATRSNFTRVHRGKPTKYLDHFAHARGVLADVLQSEQGAWFLSKRNRNMIVLVDEEIPPAEDFHWIPLRELRALLHVDGMVNMDLRTVLACMPATVDHWDTAARTRGSELPAQEHPAGCHDNVADVLSWFTGLKSRCTMTVRSAPLLGLPEWTRGPDEIAHVEGRHFSIIGVSVRAGNREVAEWDQPLLRPVGRDVIAFLVSSSEHGRFDVLVRARTQVGLVDGVEMGPTVHWGPSHRSDDEPEVLDWVLRAPKERVLFDTVLAEEGGRFHHALNRYMIVDTRSDIPRHVPDDHRWVSLLQLEALVRHGYYLNIEARTLLACLHSVAGPRTRTPGQGAGQ
ncbi:oxidase EvaA [Lipingzhangella halophila]|uniref:Oxidase EvaA n=1 Tax=Lipingzhangella halophila TaxID=1783352 RepID=A0A7W7RMB2_9ACTN|nr:oxidase EvaA [Lipingzhangella halophila]